MQPLSKIISLYLTKKQPVGFWLELLQVFIDELGDVCIDKDNTIIGHIKGIALLPKDGFISANKVSSDLPAEVDVHNVDCKQAFSQIRFTLTILVYGMNSNELKVALDKATYAVRVRFAVETAICDVH